MTRVPQTPPQTRTSRPGDRRRINRPVPQPKAEPWQLHGHADGPSVVALGGGRGLASVLAAVRRYAGSITAVVSVADDGGSSGRLRQSHGIPAPGDLRKCIVALSEPDTVWREGFEHRFRGGELDGHALGNLIIVGLTQTLGDFGQALDEVCRLLKCAGRVLPATSDPITLLADVGDSGAQVEGQVAVANASERIKRVHIVPEDAKAYPEAVTAIELADQVILAPGSLYTSLLPVLLVRGLRDAIANSRGKVVHVCNLRPQATETSGLDATAHLQAVLDHGARVDTFLYQAQGRLPADEAVIRQLGIDPVAAELAASDGVTHDPVRLARALETLL